MYTAQWKDVEGKAVTDPGAKGVTIRVLMGDNVGAPTFTMRHFEVAPGGSTPFHAHPWEHEVYVLSGAGKVRQKGGEKAVGPGSFVYVPPDEEHNFENAGEVPFTFLCVIPASRFCLK
ncbi:MAG TPA: cupin domain-containing protein [Candidatus Deferrimicrobiaceae bacterium]|nr:cupin domain-containing protein [Candidatus Deferrimicrobiaceae bacterium]